MEMGQEIPSPDRVFDYADFRAWTSEANFVVPVADIEEVHLIPKEDVDITGKDLALFKRLNARKGSIHSASVAFNAPDDETIEEISKTNFHQYVQRLRKRVQNPGIILTARGLGVGIGIAHNSFKHAESARLMFYLKANAGMNKPIPRRVAAEKLYGYTEDPENFLAVVLYHFKNSVSPEAKAAVHYPRGSETLTLVEK